MFGKPIKFMKYESFGRYGKCWFFRYGKSWYVKLQVFENDNLESVSKIIKKNDDCPAGWSSDKTCLHQNLPDSIW